MQTRTVLPDLPRRPADALLPMAAAGWGLLVLAVALFAVAGNQPAAWQWVVVLGAPGLWCVLTAICMPTAGQRRTVRGRR
jgi:uncharacterized membrane protein